MLTIKTGNIFTSNAQVLVNTVNCVGVMGAGIALECRLRYPEMFTRYQTLCESKQIAVGKLWLYKSDARWILNFPTKTHWKLPSQTQFLHEGLEKFVETYKAKGINSIAFPLLGADRGGIPQEQVIDIMTSYLENVDIDIEIYKYDPKAKDDLFDKTFTWLESQSIEQVAIQCKMRRDYVEKVLAAMRSGKVTQLNQLAAVRGVGLRTIEKVFALSQQTQLQTNLF